MDSSPGCALLFGLLVGLLLATHALELEDVSGEDLLEEHSAELPPASLHSYTRDTIVHYNPKKTDANFRQLWERVPLQKADEIKRRR